MMERRQIEGRDASQVAGELTQAFDQHCAEIRSDNQLETSIIKSACDIPAIMPFMGIRPALCNLGVLCVSVVTLVGKH